MFKSLGQGIRYNFTALIMAIVLYVAIIGAAFSLAYINTSGFSIPSMLWWNGLFIAIFFFSIMSVSFEQNIFTVPSSIIFSILMVIVSCVLYYFVIILLNENLIAYEFRRGSFHLLFIVMLNIAQIFVFVMGFMVIRLILTDIMRENNDHVQPRLSVIAAQQSLAAAAISSLMLFALMLTMLKSYWVAIVLSIIFVLYHAQWNYGTFLSVCQRKQKSAPLISFLVIQMLLLLLIILFVIFGIPTISQSLEVNIIEQFFVWLFLFNLYLVEYTWIFFLIGIAFNGIALLFVHQKSYYFIHIASLMLVLVTILIMAQFQNIWLVSTATLCSYGALCCLYGCWNKFLLLIHFGRESCVE